MTRTKIFDLTESDIKSIVVINRQFVVELAIAVSILSAQMKIYKEFFFRNKITIG